MTRRVTFTLFKYHNLNHAELVAQIWDELGIEESEKLYTSSLTSLEFELPHMQARVDHFKRMIWMLGGNADFEEISHLDVGKEA